MVSRVAIPFVEYVLLGSIAGTISFLLLWVNVRLYASPAPAWRAIALHTARVGTLTIVLVAIARAGRDPAARDARRHPDRPVNRPALAASGRVIQSPLSAEPMFHLGPRSGNRAGGDHLGADCRSVNRCDAGDPPTGTSPDAGAGIVELLVTRSRNRSARPCAPSRPPYCH